ncbi:MAG: AAA domain-containing protein, partial [Desulfofundulus sp.]
MDDDKLRICRDRLIRVFRYLEALNQHRNPVTRHVREQLWSLWLEELPEHPCIQLGEKPGFDDGEAVEGDATGDEFLLKVRRPELKNPPAPPDAIKDWLEPGWEDPDRDVTVRESITVELKGQVHVRWFKDDPERQRVFNNWKAARDEWARAEGPARKVMKLFVSLYELYGRMQKEAELIEFVLGDGILSWRRKEGGIYHPVLLQRLQLSFNPLIPEFTFSETDHDVELYSALFRALPDVDGRSLAISRDELSRGDIHPLGGEQTSAFLKRLVVRLSSQGKFIGEALPKPESSEPVIGRNPVIFLRKRTLGFTTALEGVLEDLPGREDIPGALQNIVGVEAPPVMDDNLTVDSSDFLLNEDENILLGKSANPEQIRIVRSLERNWGVLVQGPPGTGKTHTIANLLGHLLAQGKSVLVTSHTAKALRVLRQQVVSELQPLCVSVLESDSASRAELNDAVQGIVARLTRSDADHLEEEARKLTDQRKRILAELKETRQKLYHARADEYRDLVVAGRSFTPPQAARLVAEGRGRHDWIPAPVSPGAALP